ncbi:MAG TPA: hypothetical protein VHV51_22380 [Polyangiaceae bacterium]|jgi:hypothetical protein|nr:hypothetical protein [Polyangiaceae bacterium]
MNFFGHAVIAQRSEAARAEPRAEFVLGAMLPDFASMLRVRPPSVTSPTIAEGIVFHHATDDAFHGSDWFLEFSRQASSYLRERGLSRGSARAVAHVGVELLLDGALAGKAANEAYLSALDAALTDQIAGHINWHAVEQATRFRHLCHNLKARGAPHGDVPAELVAERLRNILASRPRLAMDEAGQSVVRDWVVSSGPLIAAKAKLVVNEVEQRLALSHRFER